MELKEALMQSPIFATIAVAINFVKTAMTGVDIRPIVSKTFAEAVPAIV